MADPITLTAITVAATAAAGATSAYGSYQAGQAKGAASDYQAGVAKINQQIEEQNASYSRDVGEVQAKESGMKTAQTIGLIRANQGASNVRVGTGSPAQIQSSQLEVGQYNESVIRSNAAKVAYGHEVQALTAGTQASLDTMAAETSKTTGEIGAFSSILGTVGSVASKWYAAGPAFGTSSSSSFGPSGEALG